jgi:hypothetical protein
VSRARKPKRRAEAPIVAKPSQAFSRGQRLLKAEVRNLANNVLSRSDILSLRGEVVLLRKELGELREALSPLIEAGWLKKWSKKMRQSITEGAEQ